MPSLDLRLLSVFDEIAKTRSVSRAAEAMGLGQPAVSIALARLREHFGDPLFVRVGSVMEPTPLARELTQPMRQALAAVEAALGHRSRFEAKTTTRSFVVSMSDISQVVLLPSLWARLLGEAPGVAVDVRPLSPETPQQLESGEADLAIGFIPQLDAGFYQQTLFPQRYVCLVRAGHPRVRQSLSRALYEAESHIVVSGAGTGHAIVERELERQGIHRRIALRVPNYVGLSYLIQGTDLIATIPLRLAEVISKRGRYRMFAPPVPLPGYEIKLHWHERFHHDPGSRWMRSAITRLLRT
jgi:DNA-binding transcriptional LysR family regulator